MNIDLRRISLLRFAIDAAFSFAAAACFSPPSPRYEMLAGCRYDISADADAEMAPCFRYDSALWRYDYDAAFAFFHDAAAEIEMLIFSPLCRQMLRFYADITKFAMR